MGELRINGVSYSGSGSDTKVTQNSITSSGSALPLLLANSNGTTETAEVNKDNTLTFSPSGNQMQIKADSNSVAPPTIVLRKDSGSNAPEESVQLAHLGSPNGYILRTYNNSTSRGVEVINIADSTQTTKPIITVDNTNALKSDCVVREYIDSRNIQDLANVSLTTSDNNKLLGVSVSGSSISVGAVTDLFKCVRFANSSSITVPANSAVNVTANQMNIATPSGYIPVAVTAVYSSSNDVVMRSFSAVATGTASFGVARNVSGTQQSVIFNCTLLYIKSGFVSYVYPT